MRHRATRPALRAAVAVAALVALASAAPAEETEPADGAPPPAASSSPAPVGAGQAAADGATPASEAPASSAAAPAALPDAPGPVPEPPAPPPLPPALAAVPPPVLDLHIALAPCEDPAGALLESHPPLVAALTPVARLVAIACTGDAAEATYRLYVLETGEIGGVHPLLFALPSKSLGWTGTDLLRAVALDSEGRLTGTMRDPGEGRCLSRGTWRWTGYAFALERAEMADCGPGAASGWRRVHPPGG